MSEQVNGDEKGLAAVSFYEAEGNAKLATALVNEYLGQLASAIPDQPVRCEGRLRLWDDVQRGEIVAEIQLAHAYYLDPRNPGGTLEERRNALDVKIRGTFETFIEKRTKEYGSVRCRYRGIDWNQGGNSSWKTLTCQPGFVFDTNSVVRTENGDWKAGPVWGAGNTQMSWRTGGHRRNETFAELDAVYANIPERVLEELNSARAILHDRGIPTYWVNSV